MRRSRSASKRGTALTPSTVGSLRALGWYISRGRGLCRVLGPIEGDVKVTRGG